MTVEADSMLNGEPIDLANQKKMKDEHDKIVAWSYKQFEMIKAARLSTERQWYLNLAFYFGKQWVVLLRGGNNYGPNTTSPRLYVPNAPYYRARPVINKCRPTIRTEISQLTANKPNASVVPASAEDRDMYAAMAGEQIWEHHYREKKLKSIIRRTMWWTTICGTAFMKCYWDPNAGESILDPTTGQITKQGDIVYCPETPFHVFCPDLKEEELENQPFLIHAQLKSPEFIKMNFPETFKDNKQPPNNGTDVNSIMEESFLNLVGTQPLQKRNDILVLEVWVKPGRIPLMPNGAMFTIVGDQIVQGFGQWPYKHGKYPFAKFDHIQGGKFYAHSVLEDLIPLQKEYNRTRGQIIEGKNRMAKPQLLAARGSIDPSKITSEPGQVIQYTPGYPEPKPLPLQAIPTYVIDELERIKQDWNDISGQHEVSHGQVPPGVTAATAIAYLQERDESKLSATFDSLEEGVEKIAGLTLSYAHEYWDDQRTVKVTGPEGSFDTLAFKGSDLRNGLDIRVEAGSSLPVSKAAKQAFIMDMMKMGFIDPDKGLEVMDMGGINKLYEQIQTDRRQVQRENLRMSKITPDILMQHEQIIQQKMMSGELPVGPDGQPLMPPSLVPVNTWDNHQLHIEYHNNYRKSQTFENLPVEIKDIFEQHVQEHIRAMGMEAVTMNPAQAVGLPPMPLGDGSGAPGQLDNSAPPGPSPMPQLSSEMPQ